VSIPKFSFKWRAEVLLKSWLWFISNCALKGLTIAKNPNFNVPKFCAQHLPDIFFSMRNKFAAFHIKLHSLFPPSSLSKSPTSSTQLIKLSSMTSNIVACGNSPILIYVDKKLQRLMNIKSVRNNSCSVWPEIPKLPKHSETFVDWGESKQIVKSNLSSSRRQTILRLFVIDFWKSNNSVWRKKSCVW
jgi:hypothetical protein